MNNSKNLPKSDDACGVERKKILIKPKWQLQQDLASWASNFKVHADCLTALLKLLRQYGFTELKSDSRSVMNTPRDTAKLIRDVEPGQYIHIGIAEGIKYTLRQNRVDVSKLDTIVFDYNTDGVQITESTGDVFWPIWCRLRIPNVGKPFLVGNYHSRIGQPRSFNSFTDEFVSEFKTLMADGLKVGLNKIVTIQPGIYLGDSPGRCDMLGTKHPTGYFGCARCTTTGTYKNNRVCFPELDAPLRTDKSFEYRIQPEHHHFRSLVEESLGIRCVSQAPLDGMHLVYACSTNRILFWYNTDTVNFKLRLSSAQIDLVNSMLTVAMITRPKEFARSVTNIRKYRTFKCTQYRQFLLYLSIVVMRKVLSKFQYEHFLLFVLGIRILSDPKLFKQKNLVAKKMLYEYVDILGKKFGKFRLINSIHSLIHLADECITQNAPLDTFSMWDFETANAGLKEFTKREGAYLEQCYNRTMEKYHSRFDSSIETNEFPALKCEIDKEYDDEFNVTSTYFYRVEYEHFMLDASRGNQWFLTKSGDIGQFDRAALTGDKMEIRCRMFQQKFNYFDIPLTSTLLNIFMCYEKDLSNYFDVDVKVVEAKMFLIKDGNSLVFVPLL